MIVPKVQPVHEIGSFKHRFSELHLVHGCRFRESGPVRLLATSRYREAELLLQFVVLTPGRMRHIFEVLLFNVVGYRRCFGDFEQLFVGQLEGPVPIV